MAAPPKRAKAAAVANGAAAAASFPLPDAVEVKQIGPGLVEEEGLKYMTGMGEQSSEAREGALPQGQNTPQSVPFGLVAEQLSGSAFTEPRETNTRTWFYRIHPSVGHSEFSKVEHAGLVANFEALEPNPNQFRWAPFQLPKESDKVTFVDGLNAIGGAGSPSARSGLAYYSYSCNASMGDTAFCNADGDLLIVPQMGPLVVRTELGVLRVNPNQICVVPRGIRFSVNVEGVTRGYMCELYDGHFRLPNLGPIGANGLANPRDFLTPVAAYEDRQGTFTVLQKFQGSLFKCTQDHSPFDVVAWHGNYSPFKYDLARFCVVNSVSYDHMDPSIFTVLTCPSSLPGRATLDFVIFPPRWSVHEETFRPPYFHRNCMSEFMGLIRGHYEAKAKGFLPGGATLHSIMTPHGPDRQCYEGAIKAELKPEVIAKGTQAFMFESYFSIKLTPWALEGCGVREKDYVKVWDGMPRTYKA